MPYHMAGKSRRERSVKGNFDLGLSETSSNGHEPDELKRLASLYEEELEV